MLSLVIDFKIRKFSRFFICLRSLRKNSRAPIRGFPKSVALCSQKFCGLLKMVKKSVLIKKYTHINCLKALTNCSMWVVYWQLLNRFFRGLLNILLMLGLHHRRLPENFRKIFQNTGRLLLTFNIYNVRVSKKGKLLQRRYSSFIFFALFPENPESSTVFKNINNDFYNFTVFVTSRYLSRESFHSLL